MYPAYLIRAGIDWVRHNEKFKEANPLVRCLEAIKVCNQLWEEQVGTNEEALLELAVISTYWAEFFHAADPLPDEISWKEAIVKKSAQYDSFADWQEWFKKTYSKIYKEDNIWSGIMITSWAHTHQFEVSYTDQTWELVPSISYLPTSELWRLEPHMNTVSEIINELWLEETLVYRQKGFKVSSSTKTNLGKVECLCFDQSDWTIKWPARSKKTKEVLHLGEAVADIIAPAGDDWYRRLDNIIFAQEHVDVTALINKAQYVFGSYRRLFELESIQDFDKAKEQAQAEGWLVPEIDATATAIV